MATVNEQQNEGKSGGLFPSARDYRPSTTIPLPTDEEQRNKPDRCMLGGLTPKFRDFQGWALSHKYRPGEEAWVRPHRSIAACDIQKFAYKLCARNMSEGYAKKTCFKELQDIDECMNGKKRMARATKLIDASRKVGDIVPELRSNIDWIY